MRIIKVLEPLAKIQISQSYICDQCSESDVSLDVWYFGTDQQPNDVLS
jgi:hypothetical protein